MTLMRDQGLEYLTVTSQSEGGDKKLDGLLEYRKVERKLSHEILRRQEASADCEQSMLLRAAIQKHRKKHWPQQKQMTIILLAEHTCNPLWLSYNCCGCSAESTYDEKFDYRYFRSGICCGFWDVIHQKMSVNSFQQNSRTASNSSKKPMRLT